MLGLNKNGNNIKYFVGNFFVVFGSQVAFELFAMLPQGEFPSPFQIYKSTITALIATFTIYGLNKATKKENK